LNAGTRPSEEATLSPYEPAASAVPGLAWAKRVGVVSAAGLLTGLAAARLFRSNSSKFR